MTLKTDSRVERKAGFSASQTQQLLLASLPSSCVWPWPGIWFLRASVSSVEVRAGCAQGGRAQSASHTLWVLLRVSHQPASTGLQPWGQHYTSTGKESDSLYSARRERARGRIKCRLPPCPGVKQAVYQHDLLSPA